MSLNYPTYPVCTATHNILKSTTGLINQIHWLTLNSKSQFAFALQVLMPSTVFPSLFTSSFFFFFLEPTSGSYFPFFTPRQSKRARHSELTLVTSAFPWLGICLMELIHISEGLHLCSLFWLYRHTAQPQQGDTETTPPQPPPSAVSPPKKQHRATKKAFTTCCGGTCYQHNPDQHS